MKEEEDTLEEFLSQFYVHVLYVSERRKAMRIEGTRRHSRISLRFVNFAVIFVFLRKPVNNLSKTLATVQKFQRVHNTGVESQYR